MIGALTDVLSGLLLVAGAAFTLVAALGINRLPDVYTRMHAASKAGTVGSGLMLLALAIASRDVGVASRAVAAAGFFLLTAPISTHLLARAAHACGYRLWTGSVIDAMADRAVEAGQESLRLPEAQPQD